MRRWRLVLGAEAACGRGGGEGIPIDLAGDDLQMDRVLEALYDSERSAGLGSSCPNVNRWLGDIRTYFPSPVVRIMQRDALQRLNLQQMLLEPETLEAVDADVHLVATLVSLKNVIPKKTKETARHVVRKVVEDLQRRLRNPLTEAVRGALNKATRTSRPRHGEIDWDRTIRKNLKNYLPERGTIIAERLVGYGRRRSSLRDIVLCIDQSGSMATSVVYASVFGAVLASLRAVSTRMVVFDTEVVDLTEELHDPVDLLVRRATGRRHRHQPRGGLLPRPDHPACADDLRADHRPLRRGRRPATAAARGGNRRQRREHGLSLGAERRRHALL